MVDKEVEDVDMRKMVLGILNRNLEDLYTWQESYLKDQAYIFLFSRDCEFMCECLGLNYNHYKNKGIEMYEKRKAN